MTVREAKIEDAPELMRLAFEFHRAARLKRYAMFEQCQAGWADWFGLCIADPNFSCFVAEDEKKLVGMVTGAVAPIFFCPNLTYAGETVYWISPGARGKGHGNALLRAFEEWARQKGVIFATVGATEALGAKKTGRFLRENGYKLEWRQYRRALA